MQAVTSTNTEHHPRGSGPPYGLQFSRLQDAWHRIAQHRKPNHKVHWVINGDCCLETWLWCETDEKHHRCKGVYLIEDVTQSREEPAGENFWGLCLTKDLDIVVFGPGEVTTRDELIQAWWQHHGQFNHHPWDPNGIIEARRLNLQRQQEEPDWGDDRWAELHETDKLSFQAYDNGDFDREPREVIWNRVNKAGYRWTVYEGKDMG